MTEWLTPQTLDLGVQSLSLTPRVVSLGKELYPTLSLFTQVYKWVPATYCITQHTAGGGLTSHPEGSSNTPRHASCYKNWYKLRPCGPLPYLRR